MILDSMNYVNRKSGAHFHFHGICHFQHHGFVVTLLITFGPPHLQFDSIS